MEALRIVEGASCRMFPCLENLLVGVLGGETSGLLFLGCKVDESAFTIDIDRISREEENFTILIMIWDVQSAKSML